MDIRSDITSKIKIRWIRRLSRWLRRVVFQVLNFYGNILFDFLRRLKLFPSAPRFEKDKINRILILRPDMIGDVVMATPVIKTARENFPDAYIAMVVSEFTKDIIIKNPCLDEVITVKGVGFLNLMRDLATIRSIRNKHYDLAIILFPALSCNFFAFLTGIPHRIGYGDRGSEFLLTKSLTLGDYKQKKRHMIDINLDLLRAIGSTVGDRELCVSIHPDSQKRAESFFEDNKLNPSDIVVMLHPGSTRPYQRWPADKFALLADRLIVEFKVKIIFLSGPRDGKLVEEVMKRMQHTSVIASGLALKDVVSLIKRCDLFIGHSTGTTHIADAVGTLTIMIVSFLSSADSPTIWGPWDKRSILVSKDLGCLSCITADCEDYPCMVNISVQEVFEAVEKQLKNIKK